MHLHQAACLSNPAQLSKAGFLFLFVEPYSLLQPVEKRWQSGPNLSDINNPNYA